MDGFCEKEFKLIVCYIYLKWLFYTISYTLDFGGQLFATSNGTSEKSKCKLKISLS